MSELQSSPAAIQPVRDVVDYELLFDCVHCGLCLEACPTYVLTRREMDSPRGRIYLMKALAEGRAELEPDVVRHLDLCLGCRGCETACPSGVRYGRLIEKARAYVAANHPRGLAERARRWFISALFPYPQRLRRVLWPVKLLEDVGLRPLAERTLPGKLRSWLALLPSLAAARNDHDSTPWPTAKADASGPTVAVHRGCVAQVVTDAENRNSERLLKAAGYRVVSLARTECCGALDLHLGNTERARRFARANVRELKRAGVEAIVSAGSGCSAAIAEYGELLRDDPELKSDAESVAAKVRDLSTLVLASKLTFPKFPCTVTYHDACHLRHGLGIRDEPRKLLASIPGLRLVELPEADLCCGSAGSYNLTEPEMAAELGRRKADNILVTGADYVVLSNPGCELQIAAALRRRAAKTKVIHLADFLALAMRG
jgi:glycolate oxidase iron-sulfur subunit